MDIISVNSKLVGVDSIILKHPRGKFLAIEIIMNLVWQGVTSSDMDQNLQLKETKYFQNGEDLIGNDIVDFG